jgi:Uma2 family endonuclease
MITATVPSKEIGQGADEDRHFTLYGVSWQQYETLRDTFENYAGLRLTYLEGTLEFFMPSRKHESLKTLLARLLELYALETNTRIYGFGSETYRKQATERGLEPDECYCVGVVKELPDIAIEINLTSGSIDKLEVYKGLGIPEVWIWQDSQLLLYHLQPKPDGAEYQIIPKSEFLPHLDLDLLVRCANIPDQHDAVVEFRRCLSV